jgi:lipopolysaccharide-induced tumor necrosis factor-alpha factor
MQTQQPYTSVIDEKTILQQANPNNGYVPPPANYQNATPLVSVGMSPTPVDCPQCKARQLTRIEYHSGNTTFAWAAAVCCFLGLGCIPFLMTSLKDVDHFCGHCGYKLATWHRSGRVDVFAHT